MVFVLFYKLKLVFAVGIKLHENLTIPLIKTIIKLRTLKNRNFIPPQNKTVMNQYIMLEMGFTLKRFQYYSYCLSFSVPDWV